MKDFLIKGGIVILIIGLLYAIYLREFKRSNNCIVLTSNEMVIKKSTWDSIQRIANLQPIIKHDTIIIEKPKEIKPANPKPQPNINDTIINNYIDSIPDENMDVKYIFSVKGKFLQGHWEYTPSFKEMIETRIEFVPKLVQVPTPYNVYRNGLYINGSVGGNADTFVPGIGLDYITKKNTQIGIQYQRFGDKNIYSIRIGTLIKLRK